VTGPEHPNNSFESMPIAQRLETSVGKQMEEGIGVFTPRRELAAG